MATLKDVARVTRVSAQTVSNVVNQRDVVHPETRRRVLAAVGYVPAQNLIGRAEFLFFSTDHRAELWEIHRWPESIRFSRFFKRIQ